METDKISIGADGIDAKAVVADILARVEQKRKQGVYDEARVARAEKNNLLTLKDDESFMEQYLLCLRQIVPVDMNDFEIIETWYPYFGCHSLVHELSESLQKIPLWMQCGDDSAFYTEVIKCRLLAEELSNTQQLLPENIF